MDAETSALIDAIAHLVSAIAWPALLLFVVVSFRQPLHEFLANLGELSVKAPGVEATARRAASAAAYLTAAEAARATGTSDLPPSDPQDIADSLVTAIPNARTQARIEKARVLWVDDHPDNNRYERQALAALGITIETSTSTEEALTTFRRSPYDLVISDMNRPPDSQAGYTLLERLRDTGSDTPVVFYTGAAPRSRVQEARRRGAFGFTASPPELVTLVSKALART